MVPLIPIRSIAVGDVGLATACAKVRFDSKFTNDGKAG